MNPPKPNPQTPNPKPQTLSPTDLPALFTTYPPGVKLQLEILPNGAIHVADTTPKTKTQLIDELFPHLKGQGISISNAAKKYGVPRGAVNDWVYVTGYLHFVDETCYPKLVDEAEVALCAQIYHARRAANTAGLPYFNDQGHIITTIKRPAAARNRPPKNPKPPDETGY
ncbi:MAG: hypothetical protein L6R45_29590 [Anaerolineae bacterium]|nr:hypothetical protein [Anaerolineae bacterium]